jgi:predicted ATPase/class 3 adenylate cyclase
MTEMRAPAPNTPPGMGEVLLSTFLLTDIEGSTRLWETHGEVMGAALAVHDGILRHAIESRGGTVVKTTGDGMLAVFDDQVVAVRAALGAQRALRDSAWGPTGQLRVRMAVHAGAAETREGDFFGPALNRDARILAIGHGGQILLSAVAAVLARDRLPADVDLLDLGSHRLRDLDRPEQVFQVAVADLPRDFPPLRSLSTRRSNLPVPMTSFVGRERELAEVDRLIARGRLVTLIGTGGTGKTRLMIEVAGRAAERFTDGAWLAELAPLGDPSQIAPEIARALGAPEVPGRPALDVVSDFLASKELLLVLDNAEHLIDGVASVAERLLAVAPGVRILATSREALAVPGEAVVQIPSLSCPGGFAPSRSGVPTVGVDFDEASGTEAVRLFAERAGAVLPSFELTAGNVDAVSEICRRLDGIPLAIELAAGRVSAMSPQEIALGLGDRFRLLTGGRRTAVPRQQTLHALIDWSWDLLTDDDRRLLRRLSIFAGGWTAGAAARIAGEVGNEVRGRGASGPAAEAGIIGTLDGLTRLVDRSLVIVDRGPTTSYRMLETIRQYARERLIESGEAAAIADRHLAFFAGLAEAAAPELRGPSMADWLDRVDADLDNLGAALEWGLESSPETAVRMCLAMLTYWRVRVASPDNQERVIAAVGAARALLAGPPEPTAEQRAVVARLLGEAATVWSFAGGGEIAIGWAEEAVTIARPGDDTGALIAALVGHSIARIFTGFHGNLSSFADELLHLAHEADDWWTIATAAGGMAGGMSALDPVAAEDVLRVAVAAARRTGNPHAIAMTAMAEGRLFSATGRIEEARSRFEEAIARFAELGDERFLLAVRSELAHAVRRAGLLDEAMDRYRETMSGWIRLGNRGAVAHQLENIAFLLIEQGDDLRAASLLATAETLRETLHSPMLVTEFAEHEDWVTRLRGAAEMPAVEAAMAAGRAMSMVEAVALATG